MPELSKPLKFMLRDGSDSADISPVSIVSIGWDGDYDHTFVNYIPGKNSLEQTLETAETYQNLLNRLEAAGRPFFRLNLIDAEDPDGIVEDALAINPDIVRYMYEREDGWATLYTADGKGEYDTAHSLHELLRALGGDYVALQLYEAEVGEPGVVKPYKKSDLQSYGYMTEGQAYTWLNMKNSVDPICVTVDSASIIQAVLDNNNNIAYEAGSPALPAPMPANF